MPTTTTTTATTTVPPSSHLSFQRFSLLRPKNKIQKRKYNAFP
uniref:Uncharacterized protein n=1 Tax=Rhizophora mucronata TaxID=61149 RepID=A0A2P2IK39_RHIMU